jgi:hypothetical protein
LHFDHRIDLVERFLEIVEEDLESFVAADQLVTSMTLGDLARFDRDMRLLAQPDVEYRTVIAPTHRQRFTIALDPHARVAQRALGVGDGSRSGKKNEK